MDQSPFLNRWRIMALLIESLQNRQYVSVDKLLVNGGRYSEAEDVLEEAGMERVTDQTWMPGHQTYHWIIYNLGFYAGGFSWRHQFTME